MNIEEVIKRPLILTEKGSNLRDSHNQYLFEVDLPLAWTLGRMELAGILVDPDDLASMGDEFAERLRGYVLRIAGHTDERAERQQLVVEHDDLFSMLAAVGHDLADDAGA